MLCEGISAVPGTSFHYSGLTGRQLLQPFVPTPIRVAGVVSPSYIPASLSRHDRKRPSVSVLISRGPTTHNTAVTTSTMAKESNLQTSCTFSALCLFADQSNHCILEPVQPHPQCVGARSINPAPNKSHQDITLSILESEAKIQARKYCHTRPSGTVETVVIFCDVNVMARPTLFFCPVKIC